MQKIAARLEGRFALITGGSRGIGRAVAVRFAAEGASVAINYVGDAGHAKAALDEVEASSRAAGYADRKHRLVDADVASADAVQGMVQTLIADWGRLDILVNNAGIQATTPGDGFDHAEFDRVLAVNLKGAAYCAEAAIKHFLTRPGGGAIINTSSVHERVPKPGYLAYSVSKGGLGNLTRTLALEFADRGIRVNAVGPGAVLTEMNDSWRHDPTSRAAVEAHIPMGRAATPEEMAPVFAFLASDDASYVTGQTLHACGGLTLYGDFKQNWSS
ncbi:MAG: glucose 1-dehydrogenase [Proteobacteria bacterium]|nr:glucose 1-dehydrogenase [Pseudomonadota bacterium]MBI3496250.1 glucose 1-dehydrogenase [Pseudomonadota bacterium]